MGIGWVDQKLIRLIKQFTVRQLAVLVLANNYYFFYYYYLHSYKKYKH